MQYARVGRTGLMVSRLCIGTGTFGHQTESKAFQALGMAAAAGVNFIDAADMYPAGTEPNQMGDAERITGRWLKGKRHRFIVSTKAGRAGGPSAWLRGSPRKHLLDAVDASLLHLDTDYVDLYQLHVDDPAIPLDETAEALDLIVRSGKARFIGVSNFLSNRLTRAIGQQETARLVRFVPAQPRYNLLNREIERELIPLALEVGLSVIPFNPLADGLLSRRNRKTGERGKGGLPREMDPPGEMHRTLFWRGREFETIEHLLTIARAHGVSLPTLSVAWIMANPAITSVIVGASGSAQLMQTLAAADYRLKQAMKSRLDDLTAEYRHGDAGR
ncbi:Predicted oxidoreductase [Paraburkholderia sabiae]|uniref:aldo/keto reductase n=1 Tax=Paraburkholderia sabiae TaxID=273251 RepID=UPI001CAB24E3|nr:aldo/keto reductase [Paraburkholderia sabiae]CAG9229820.1 Predicted oxidoreductase [Paraburkholderia sabiae]